MHPLIGVVTIKVVLTSAAQRRSQKHGRGEFLVAGQFVRGYLRAAP
ncbi:MAG: hypothetical protein VKI42_10335 [Synechococcaceae cyanobacterium]|nr:hypothetical protein [Synechococcaceae cyanobacterium]